MNPVFSQLAQQIQAQAADFLPRAYALGKKKTQQKWGISAGQWTDKDNANISLLLTRHADELAKSMAALEQRANAGNL
jgi:hypothetical protein